LLTTLGRSISVVSSEASPQDRLAQAVAIYVSGAIRAALATRPQGAGAGRMATPGGTLAAALGERAANGPQTYADSQTSEPMVL